MSAFTAVAAFASAPANAYIFGNSEFNLGNTLTLNGGTVLANSTSGWFQSTGGHLASNRNYIAAAYNGLYYNDFFVFDLSSITAPVITASLTVFSYTVDLSDDGGTWVPFSLYDVSVSHMALAANSFGDIAVYDDLGSGSYYGGRRYTEADSNSFQTITLTAAAVSDINAAIAGGDGTFIIGGSTYPTAAALPEPMSLALIGVGVAELTVARRRRAG